MPVTDLKRLALLVLAGTALDHRRHEDAARLVGAASAFSSTGMPLKLYDHFIGASDEAAIERELGPKRLRELRREGRTATLVEELPGNLPGHTTGRLLPPRESHCA